MFGTFLLVFLVLHTAPGDPMHLLVPPDEMGGSGPEADALRERLREELGLNKPLHEQFIDFLLSYLRLDFGRSLRSNRPILPDIIQRLPATLELGLVSLLVTYLIGLPAGILSARGRGTWVDHASMLTAIAGVSMPVFWLGFLFMLLFGIRLDWLPVGGRGGPLWTLEGWKHIILPATTLGVIPAAIVARLMRSGMLDVLEQDYIRVARAKGLRERAVYLRHAIKNALLPVLTHFGMRLGAMISGTFVIEYVFAWPGIGQFTVDAIGGRDYPVVQATVILTAFGYVMGNLLADIMCAYVDPRIRAQ
jgi:peptide/nickel transport system permease protein